MELQPLAHVNIDFICHIFKFVLLFCKVNNRPIIDIQLGNKGTLKENNHRFPSCAINKRRCPLPLDQRTADSLASITTLNIMQLYGSYLSTWSYNYYSKTTQIKPTD